MGPINNNNFNWERALFKKKGGGSVKLFSPNSLEEFTSLVEQPLAGGLYIFKTIPSDFTLQVDVSNNPNATQHWYFVIYNRLHSTITFPLTILWLNDEPSTEDYEYIEISLLASVENKRGTLITNIVGTYKGLESLPDSDPTK